MTQGHRAYPSNGTEMPEGAAASCPAQGPAVGHKEHAKVETGEPPGRWGLPTAEGTGTRKGGAQSRGGNLEAGTGPSGTGNAPKDSVEPCAAPRASLPLP